MFINDKLSTNICSIRFLLLILRRGFKIEPPFVLMVQYGCNYGFKSRRSWRIKYGAIKESTSLSRFCFLRDEDKEKNTE